MDIVREKLKLLPDNPGVYIMLDKYSNVIYVGKARVLKNRVRQYFHSSPKPDKVMRMVENIADFNYIITKTEHDALALENNLIKKYKPKYNILLKDDKTYPYIKVDLHEDYPAFYVTRRVKKDGARSVSVDGRPASPPEFDAGLSEAAERGLAASLKVNSIPFAALLDADGKPIFEMRGCPRNCDAKDFVKQLRAAIRKSRK